MPSRPTLRKSALAAFALTLATTGLTSFVSANPAGTHDRDRHSDRRDDTTVVRSGESIQAAIDEARSGDRIIVRAGTYAEQLTIDKSGIELVGRDAVLVPPAAPVANTCSGLAGPDTEAGICVTGRDVQLAPFVVEHRKLISVGRRVRDVSVSGFDVRGFSGANIALVGASGARLDDNHLGDNANYGAVTVGSKDTRISANVVTNSTIGFIGICVDDAEPAVVSHNDVSGSVVGLCIQTQRADIRDNEVHDNCIGVFIDPGIGAYVHDNHIFRNNAPCDTLFGYFTGIGVFVQGAGAEVKHNHIEGHRPVGFGAGLVLGDADPPFAPATDNVVKRNHFDDNTLDIQVISTGSGNVVARNHCNTSDPAGICS